MRTIFKCFLAAALLAHPSKAPAKPLLLNSEDTFASLCLASNDAPERLVQICEAALEAQGASKSQRLEMMNTLAWAYIDLDQADGAATVFEGMLSLDPESALGLNGLAWIAWDDNDFESAKGYFQRSLASEYSAEALAGLASSRFGANEASLEETALTLEAAHAMDLDYIWPIRELAWILYRDFQFEESETLFRRVLEMTPEDDNALFGLNRALRYQDKPAEALEHINAALALDEGNLEYVYDRGLILLFLGRYRVALRDAERLIEAVPETTAGHVLKARVLYYSGNGEAAIDLLKRYREEVRKDGWLSYWLADIYQVAELHQDALELLALIEIEGEPASYHHQMVADSALAIKDLTTARRAVERMLAEPEPTAHAVYIDAVLMAHDKRFDLAQARVEEALELGYSESDLGAFYGALAKHGEYVRLIEFRVRLNDAARAMAAQ